jgi:hypothetical protein
MMKTLKIWLLLMLVSLSALAQDLPMVEVRLLCFQRAADGPDQLRVATPDGVSVSLPLPTHRPSVPVAVPVAGGKIEFRRDDAEGTVAAMAVVPPGMKKALILFFPMTKENPPLIHDTVVIDDGPGEIPEDGVLVMNIHPQDVRVVVGEHRVQLRPGRRAGLKRPEERDDFNMSPVIVQFPKGDGWQTVTETLIRFPPAQQYLFIAFTDPRTKRPTMRTIRIES